MSSLIISGDTSGSITVAVPTNAGSGTLTLPLGTDTLVGKDTTDTLTNKTLTNPTITGNAAVSANTTTGNLSVSGATSLAATTVTGNLTVTANTTTGNLTVSSALNYGGVLLTNAVTGTGKMVLDTTPAIATPVLTNPTLTNYVETLQAVGTVGASSTLSLTTGTVLTATLTASTPCTFTMPTATAGKSFILILTQAATGMTTATFTSVKFPGATPPTITATASAKDIISFVSDGTNWYGNAGQAFA